MDCPYCGKEMREGSVPANRWYPGDSVSNGVKMAKYSFENLEYETPAFYCEECRKVIISIPPAEEMESVFEKLEKKLTAYGQQRIEEREQKQAEKTAEKEKRQREKSRKKDPWEDER